MPSVVASLSDGDCVKPRIEFSAVEPHSFEQIQAAIEVVIRPIDGNPRMMFGSPAVRAHFDRAVYGRIPARLE